MQIIPRYCLLTTLIIYGLVNCQPSDEVEEDNTGVSKAQHFSNLVGFMVDVINSVQKGIQTDGRKINEQHPQQEEYNRRDASRPAYCKVCESHTVCRHPQCELQGPCKNVSQYPLTHDEKWAILNYHNTLRNKIALGQYNSFPSAENMNQLKWDYELAFIAQCWANQCKFDHDQCRDTPHDKVGQNILYRELETKEQAFDLDMGSLMDEWGAEMKDFAPQHVERRSGSMFYKIGQLTQMIWATTDKIGCARVYSMENSQYKLYLYCNYATLGSYPNQAVYQPGPPASGCRNRRTPSPKFEGLCA